MNKLDLIVKALSQLLIEKHYDFFLTEIIENNMIIGSFEINLDGHTPTLDDVYRKSPDFRIKNTSKEATVQPLNKILINTIYEMRKNEQAVLSSAIKNDKLKVIGYYTFRTVSYNFNYKDMSL